MKTLQAFGVTLVLLLLAACGDPAGNGQAKQPTITLTPTMATLELGGTQKLTAAVKDGAGSSVDNPELTWASADPTVATVNAEGVVTGIKAGETTISATYRTVKATASIKVEAAAARPSITVSPPEATIGLNATRQLTATVKDTAGNTVANPVLTWSSDAPAVANVSATGLVTSFAVGTANISVSFEGVTATAVLTVELMPTVTLSPVTAVIGVGSAPLPLSITVTDINGAPVANPAVTWSSSDTAIATVSNGLVTPVAQGVTEISATFEGVTETATITVRNQPEVTIIQPSSSGTPLYAGFLLEFIGEATDSDGEPLSGTSLVWSSDRSGQLASGATFTNDSLTSGPHLITLTATDDNGITGTASVSIDLLAATFSAFGDTITAGSNFACGLDMTGAAYCWGDNTHGQLGDGTTDQRNVPTPVVGGHTFAAISAGSSHVVALTDKGVLYSWGNNQSGQLGNGTIEAANTPRRLPGNQAFIAISAGASHTVALTPRGKAYGWGSNTAGQLGNGTSSATPNPTPVEVAGGHTFELISAGAQHTVALDEQGNAYGWGNGANGRLGHGNNDSSNIPVAVAGDLSFSAITAGGVHTTAIRADDGRAYSWGRGDRLGNNSTLDNKNEPTPVNGIRAYSAVSTSSEHTLALDTNGAAYAWGPNPTGAIGNGSTDQATVFIPVAVIGGHNFVAVAAGDLFTVAIDDTGAAWAWGRSSQGRLGDGGQIIEASRNTPHAVQGGIVFKN